MESDWANLPKHLLDSILERLLSSSDYLRFSVVCKPWFGAAKHNQTRHAKKRLSHPEPPMLLFFNDKEDAWSLYNVVENKVLDVQLRLPKKRFCGSSKGWLVVVEEDFAVTLINPFSKSKGRGERQNLVIRLPQLNPPEQTRKEMEEDWGEDCEYFVIKAIITADPILNVNDCIVVIIYMECQVAFIRPSKDTSWTYIDNKYCWIMDVLQREEDKFYAVTCLGELFTFNVTSESNSDVSSFASGMLEESPSIREYLVNSNGQDLLMIQRYCSWEEIDILHKRFAEKFRVFKFNFDKCRWIEENTLGDDVAVFIGENLSISVVASNFPGCKRNCIYYNHDYDFIQKRDKLHDFGVYDMEEKSISKPYSKDVMTLLEMTNQRPIWFTPTFQM